MGNDRTNAQPLKWCLWTLFFAVLAAYLDGWMRVPALWFLAASGGVLAEENTKWDKWREAMRKKHGA
jgi:hypothetical protein